MINIKQTIEALSESAVEFIIIGGIAIRFRSSGYMTNDFDLCYLRTNENLKRLAAALAPFNPRFRDYPENLPFIWDDRTLLNGTNFTLKTTLGDIDLLGEVSGLGSYKEVSEYATDEILYNYKVRILSVDGLILAKRAAGRTKDLLVLPELEALREVLSEE